MERISTLRKTKEILNSHGIYAKKGYGQNFLVDSNIIDKICDNANIDDKYVIEIGPGIGALTEELVKRAKKVLCYEIDSDMVEILKENISNPNLIIINDDFLKVDINSDINKYFNCELKDIIVVSNLPYYITTPIIFKLINEVSDIFEYYFMVQKEVGARLTSKVKDKDYSALSVMIEYKKDAFELFVVSRNCFYPVPNVDSEIVYMKNAKRDYSVNNEAKFGEFVQNIFAMRRKTLVNNISNKYNINKDKITKILVENNYSPNIRAEELEVKEIVKLYKIFNQ